MSDRPRAAARAKGLLEALEASLAGAVRTPEGAAEPVAILWTDADAQWEPLMPRLRTVAPHVLTLGDYAPATKTGPAIWLRCVVDRALPDVGPPPGTVPILYLPRVARQELRAAEECPPALQPLVELQYRGRVWHQRNGRDWSVEAFLSSDDGLGLDVAQDARTRDALLRALPLLAELPIDSLRGKRLDADDFDRLAVSDPIRDLLRWMAAPEAFRAAGDEGRWRAFCGVCRSELGFDPERRTPLDAAEAMVDGNGKWADVWRRFCEAPRLYPGISALLREVPVDRLSLFTRDRSPRVNEAAETDLKRGLEAAAEMPQAGAVEKVLALETEHATRREWVWAQVGESPLALALEPLARLASLAREPLGGATLPAALDAYSAGGWRCDRAALDACGAVRAPEKAAVVRAAVRAIYGPWLDATARHFQHLVTADEAAARALVKGAAQEGDVCLLFVDGLRYDVGATLEEKLAGRGLRVRSGYRLAPVPTVTATAKPMATPLHDALEGGTSTDDFEPRFRQTGQAATATRLREAMAARLVDVLGDEARPPASGRTSGWMEAGRLDQLGHTLGIDLASQTETEIDALADRVVALLDSGWIRVRVVTDHGWLLLPGGLPRVDLPAYLVSTRWARCAAVRGHSTPATPVHGWYWNAQARIASAPGVACFIANTEYAHGGLSLQECVVPDLLVERGSGATTAAITSVQWRGMRCRVGVRTNDPTVRVDLRLNWRQASTSVAAAPKDVGFAGEVSLAVADDAHEGAAATVVVLDVGDTVLDRRPTTIGEAS